MKSAVYLVTIPLLAQQVVNLPSLAARERAMGARYASEIRRQSEPLADPAVQDYVQRLGRELGAPADYRFEVITGSDWTEPFALPGGFIFVPTRAFIDVRDAHEFAGTLAHAIAHATLRHGIRTANRERITNVASIPLVFMGGWTGAHADSRHTQVLVPASLLESQRTNELEADRYGLELAARAGYDPAAFGRYVERTHPANSKHSPLPERGMRIAAIQEAARSLPVARVVVSREFESIQERVRSLVQRQRRRAAPTLHR